MTEVASLVRVGWPPARSEAFQPRTSLRSKIQGQRDVVLTGERGTGKSQLAAAVYQQARETGTYLLAWVSAATPHAVTAAYAEAAGRVPELAAGPAGDADRSRLFRAWLTTTDRPWLIVLDDVADPADLEELWPAGPRGHVIATARPGSTPASGPDRQLVRVGAFEPQESVAYLRDRLAAARPDVLEPAEAMEGARQLADTVGHLPLALAQAAAVALAGQPISYAAYEKVLAGRLRDLAGIRLGETLAGQYARTVAITSSLAIEHADGQERDGLASRALRLAVFLDPAGVPEALVEAAAGHLMSLPPNGLARAALRHGRDASARPAGVIRGDGARESLWQTRAAREYLCAGRAAGHADPAVSTEDAQAAVRTLHRLHLVTLPQSAGAQQVRVHALVQRAVAEQLSGPQQTELIKASAAALAESGMTPKDYLIDLNKTAQYVFTRGAPFFVRSHYKFVKNFIAKSQDLPVGAISPKDLGRGELQRSGLWAFAIRPLFTILPFQLFLSSVSSGWIVIRKGIRTAPPLITAVVVVFVTGDAWRILGTGFTLRFVAFVSSFLLASLLFLIRRHYWKDIDASEDEAAALLQAIGRPMKFFELMQLGAQAVPIQPPRRLSGRVCVYLGYLLLTAFALIVVAAFVSSCLIVVGLILVDARETRVLAHSVTVYKAVGNVVLTRQLVSLSCSLGAFAAFFLIATQRPEDRKAFMDNVLYKLRQAMLVYTIYCHAHDRAFEWTKVDVKADPLCAPPSAGVNWSAGRKAAGR
jgi:hypothetical protein